MVNTMLSQSEELVKGEIDTEIFSQVMINESNIYC